MKISIIGLGIVGSAMEKSYKIKNIHQNNFDKYKNIGKLENCLNSDIIFLCLPTPYSKHLKKYDKTSLRETLGFLNKNTYNGPVVIKSTVEPETTNFLYKQFTKLNLIHNPEFLSSKTAFKDFHNQTHVVLGKHKKCSISCYNRVKNFYKKYYSSALLSECDCNESESMKIFVNSFYASKIQLFNEYYLLCQKTGINFDRVRELMIKNNWINPMHTLIPGTDGKLSYGGACFPKDTNALNEFMKRKNSLNHVLNSVITEHDEIRN